MRNMSTRKLLVFRITVTYYLIAVDVEGKQKWKTNPSLIVHKHRLANVEEIRKKKFETISLSVYSDCRRSIILVYVFVHTRCPKRAFVNLCLFVLYFFLSTMIDDRCRSNMFFPIQNGSPRWWFHSFYCPIIVFIGRSKQFCLTCIRCKAY